MKLHSCYEDGTAVASSRRDNKRGLFLEGRQMILACKKGQNQMYNVGGTGKSTKYDFQNSTNIFGLLLYSGRSYILCIAQCYTTWWMQGALWGYKMAQQMSVKLWKSYIVRKEKEGVASASESNSIHNPIWKQSANNLSSDRHIYAIVLISFYTYVWLCKTIIFT